VKQLDSQIAFNEMRLKSGVNSIGERLTDREAQDIRQTLENARREHGILTTPATSVLGKPVAYRQALIQPS